MERLGEAVRTELTTLEEVLAQRTELVAAARGARRQAEAVAQQLQELAFWRGVPLSPLQVAEDVSFVEEYRWVTLHPGGHGAVSGDTCLVIAAREGALLTPGRWGPETHPAMHRMAPQQRTACPECPSARAEPRPAHILASARSVALPSVIHLTRASPQQMFI